MRRKLSLGVSVVAALLVISTAGYSWNNATHAYIATKLANLMPILKMNQVYGITAPDMFNLDFSLMTDAVLRGYTHGVPAEGGGLNEDFLAVWRNADGPFQKAAASGYVAHNDAWGADYVAHWKAIAPYAPTEPFPGIYADQPPGFIIMLAVQLDMLMDSQGVWTQLEALIGAPLPISDRMTFTHNVIEFAGDIVINRADPLIGQKLMEAAITRNPSFWALIMRAFPHNYQPIIKAAEETFKQQDIMFGSLLLTGNEQLMMETLSNLMAELTVQYLSFKTGQDFSGLQTQLYGLVLTFMGPAVDMCVAAHYTDEVNLTVDQVAAQLQAHNISSKLLR